MKGSRYRFRDFIYIDDVVDAWVMAIDKPVTFGKTYNLATGKKTFVHQLINKEIKTFNLDPMTYPVKYEGTTPSDQFGLYADVSKIQLDLNWHPKTNLKTGLARMADWAAKKKNSANNASNM